MGILDNLRSRESLVGWLAMLAGEITDLASSRGSRVAHGSLAAHERVDVSTSSSTVAIGRDRVVVEMVDCNKKWLDNDDLWRG